MSFRSMATAIAERMRWANIAGVTFGGKRDLYKALGYQRELFPEDYRARYKRNAVAARVVEAAAKDTWRGGGEIVEDQNLEKETEFEQAWLELDKRLKVWVKLQRADILAGIGRYSIVVIGAPGALDTPLESVNGPEDIAYLSIYGEYDATVETFVLNETDPRFGLPEMYAIRRNTQQAKLGGGKSNAIGKRIHWTRVLHVSEGLLDDEVYGTPRLERVWNLIDDLEKVTGGGAEAFWKRADGGLHLNLDPTIDLGPEEETALQTEVDEYTHELRRTIRTRGLEINRLGSDVADFSRPVDSIIAQISAGTGIPQRILMGSERGQLASTQDRTNWDERVSSRRLDFAEPMVIRAFIDRLIGLGALPQPKQEYEVRWSQLRVLDDTQRADLASKWATLNQQAGTTVVTPNEIRERALNFAPLEEVEEPVVASRKQPQRKIKLVERDRRGLIARIVEEEEARAVNS